MIGYAKTVGIGPSWFARPATKPGHGEPEPVSPVSTRAAPEHVAVCLRCPLPECLSGRPDCPLHGRSPVVRQRTNKKKEGT